jgi:hypothetical protein
MLALYTGIAPVPGSTMIVRLAGTLVPATIFLDPLSTPLGNPFTADQNTGAWRFYADDAALYDVTAVSVAAPPTAELTLQLTASGVSPARVIRLYAIDQGNPVLLVTQTY